MLLIHKAAAEVTRYSFIGGEAYMLSELIPDEISDHFTSQDDRSMRVIPMNTMWHLFGDLLTSVRSFCPNAHELLVNPHNIILENLQTPSNRPIILKLREEFQRSSENPDIDQFISLIFSKLPIWKLMVIALDLKKRATPGVTAQRTVLKLLETISELSWHAKVCIVPNRKFSMNTDGVQFLTFRSQLFEKLETLTRTRGMLMSRNSKAVQKYHFIMTKYHWYLREKSS